jgi:hypothetical protein
MQTLERLVTAGAPVEVPRARRPMLRVTTARADIAAAVTYLGLGIMLISRFLGDPRGRVSSYLEVDHTWFQWLLAHGAHSVRHLSNPLVSYRQNAPDGVNMIANTSVLGVTIPLAPVTMIFGAAVAYLVWMVIATSGTALTTYWVLSRHTSAPPAGALIAGAFAGFAPGVIYHANGQPNFVSNMLVPILLWRVAVLGRDGRWLRDGLILGALVTWQLFINEEVLLVTALSCAVALVCHLVMDLPGAKARGRDFLRALGVTALLATVLCAYPIWYQFTGPGSFHGMPYFNDWGEDPLTWLSFARGTIAGDPAQLPIAPAGIEQNSWFGWPLVLVTAGLLVLMRRSAHVRTAGWIMLIFTVLSLGPVLRFGGAETGLPGPLSVFPADTPIVNMMLPSRLIYATTGAMTLLIALGWKQGRSRRRSVAVRLAIAAALIPLIPTPIQAKPDVPVPEFVTSGAWRTWVPEGRTLVPVPLPENPTGREAQAWSAVALHEFAMPEGYFIGPSAVDGSGQFGPMHRSHLTGLVHATLGSGAAPEITDADRELVRADLARWSASVVVVREAPEKEQLRVLMERLLGPAARDRGVWLWRV